MRITVAIWLDLALAANGLLMLFDSAGWYAVAPDVPETGPLDRISSATSAAPTSYRFCPCRTRIQRARGLQR
jgi:hypothetical protein